MKPWSVKFDLIQNVMERVIEHEYYQEILESMPSEEDIRSAIEDQRYHEWAENNPKRRIA